MYSFCVKEQKGLAYHYWYEYHSLGTTAIKLPAQKSQYSEGNSHSLKRDKQRAVTLVNTLNIAEVETTAWRIYIFMNCDLLFQAFVGIFYQASSAKVHGSIFVLATVCLQGQSLGNQRVKQEQEGF